LLIAWLLATAALVSGQGPSAAATVAAAPRAFLPFLSVDKGPFDMADFIVGDGRLYEVWQYIASTKSETQARHQTQFEAERFYHTKGNELHAEWEELWMDDQFVYRGTDTSPGGGLYYTLRDNGQYGSKWSPRYWRVGDVFERDPWVTFYDKSNCAVNAEFPQRTWLRFSAYYPQLTLGSGIVVQQAVAFDWLLAPDGEPVERYYYARDFGLVGWEDNQGDFSYVSEVHDPGARPDNTREVIGCLDTGPRTQPDQPLWPLRPYLAPYRAK
jgi:hypothetical protein